MTIIYVFTTAFALVSALTVSACMLSSRISQRGNQTESYKLNPSSIPARTASLSR